MPVLLYSPTAVHDVPDGQDTPLSSVDPEPAALAVVTSDQLVPFHFSANDFATALSPPR